VRDLRLHRVTGDNEFRDVVMEVLAYERELFRPEIGNWAMSPGEGSGAVTSVPMVPGRQRHWSRPARMRRVDR
jgi:hypothetical protein